MAIILIRYGELALKGANRHIFENKLRDNIVSALGIAPNQVLRYKTQIVAQMDDEKLPYALEQLALVSGISWFAPAVVCDSEPGEIAKTAARLAEPLLDNSMTFAIRAKRSNKRLPFSSNDVGRQAGSAVAVATGAGVNLDQPDVEIFVISSKEGSYVFAEKHAGPGGMPTGTAGKTLALLSGGFDSITAAYFLARRGAQVDFLHFHVFTDSSRVLDSKITTISARLAAATQAQQLHLSSYLPFEMKVLQLGEHSYQYEIILFRRLMVRVAEILAGKHGYQAVVLGDSLAQVASQTMENIIAVNDAVRIPLFRPLIGMDKHEIIDWVHKLHLYEAATAPYKDCCSIISTEPVIKAYLPKVHSLEEKLDLIAIAEEVAGQIETVAISSLQPANTLAVEP